MPASARTSSATTAKPLLSQGSVEQASTVEGLEMNVKEISQHISQSAENAQQASQMVENVGTQIMESNQKMQEMIQAMNNISACSDEIGTWLEPLAT